MQGFRNTGDAIFPPEENYLDVPGFRMIDGSYRNLQFAAGSDLFLLARSADASDASLYAMRYADPKVCSIPNVGSFQAAYGVYQGAAVIGYFEKDATPDPQCAAPCLRFADAACNLYSLSLPSATLPMDEEASGFAVFSAGNLVFVDPPAGTTRMLVQAVQGIVWHALGDVSLVAAQNRIGAFQSNGTELGWFGSGIVGGSGAGTKFFYEDTAGIHSLSSSGGASPTITDKVVAQGGCHLNFPFSYGATDVWILYDPACDGSKVTAYGVNSGHSSDLGFSVDARYLELAPAWPATSGDPGVDPFFYLHLTTPDDATGLGTLVLRTPDGVEHTLGSGAALERATLFAAQDGTWGYALVDVDAKAGTGTLIHFLPDGTTAELAHQVVRGTSDLIVNFDGTWGDFALPTDSGVSVLAHHVPPRGFLFREQKGRWTALLHDYQDSLATLAITTSPLDFFRSAQTPAPAPTLEDLASGVLRGSTTQFLTSLPGIAFMTNYDVQKKTGKLQYRNLELQFTATVAEGLSDYISTDDGLIYGIPAGDNAGIWAVRAR